VGEGGDEVSVARFIADQRTNYRVPHTVTCALLGVSVAWFYKWLGRAQGPGAASGLHTPRDRRRDSIDRAVAVAFKKARGLHGSPRLLHDLRDAGWTVSERTVADSMRRQGLVARRIKRRNGLTRQDKTAPKFPDLLRRDFTAQAPNLKWVGDMTEIPTGPDGKGPKLYLATVIDLYSRRLLGAATGLRPDAELACAAIKMAVAARGGKAAIWREDEAERVVFHTDRGSTGGFQRSSQHLDHGGVRWDGARRSCQQHRWVPDGSGLRIGRCVHRCVHRGGPNRRGRCSELSGV
jgi:putative transposase